MRKPKFGNSRGVQNKDTGLNQTGGRGYEKLEKPTFIPFSIVLGSCLDGVIVYNLLKA